MSLQKIRSLIFASLPLLASLLSSSMYHSKDSQPLVTTPARMQGFNLIADGTAPAPPRPSKQGLNLVADGTAPAPPRPSKQGLNLVADGTAPAPPRPSKQGLNLVADGTAPAPPRPPQALNADFVTA
jgi:hypothetical protein